MAWSSRAKRMFLGPIPVRTRQKSAVSCRTGQPSAKLGDDDFGLTRRIGEGSAEQRRDAELGGHAVEGGLQGGRDRDAVRLALEPAAVAVLAGPGDAGEGGQQGRAGELPDHGGGPALEIDRPGKGLDGADADS